MSRKRPRTYELYTEGPGFPIHTQTKFYRSGMWIARVRAKSIKQAYWLLGAQRVCLDRRPMSEFRWGTRSLAPVGVLSLSNSRWDVDWPWSLPKELWEQSS